MLPKLHKIKGIHPGTLLHWELNNLNLKAIELAEAIGEHKQTISAIINKRRSINPNLSIKLAKQFNIDTDYFMLLQASYDVKIAEQTEVKNIPNLETFRKALFWDTNFERIDWIKNKRAVIQRVLERGNKKEIGEIINFYGRETIKEEIKAIKSSFLPSFKENLTTYNLI